MTAPTITRKPVSEPQWGLIVRLCTERGIDLAEVDRDTLTGGGKGSASSLISALFKLPRVDGVESTPRNWEPEPGLYRRGEDIFKVTISRSGNWYAERCLLPVEGDGRRSLDWEYMGKRVNLKDAEVLTEAEAGRFLVHCVRCGAELTKDESKARGMGPVCADKAGL